MYSSNCLSISTFGICLLFIASITVEKQFVFSQDVSVSGSTSVSRSDNKKTISLKGNANQGITNVVTTVNAKPNNKFVFGSGKVFSPDGVSNWVVYPNNESSANFSGYLASPTKKTYSPVFAGEFQPPTFKIPGISTSSNRSWDVTSTFNVTDGHSYLNYEIVNDATANIIVTDNFDSNAAKDQSTTIDCPIGTPNENKTLTNVYNAGEAYVITKISLKIKKPMPNFNQITSATINCEVDTNCQYAAKGEWNPATLEADFKIVKIIIPTKWKQIDDNETNPLAKQKFQLIVNELRDHEHEHVADFKKLANEVKGIDYLKKIMIDGCRGKSQADSIVYLKSQVESIHEGFRTFSAAKLQDKDNEMQKLVDAKQRARIQALQAPFDVITTTPLHKP